MCMWFYLHVYSSFFCLPGDVSSQFFCFCVYLEKRKAGKRAKRTGTSTRTITKKIFRVLQRRLLVFMFPLGEWQSGSCNNILHLMCSLLSTHMRYRSGFYFRLWWCHACYLILFRTVILSVWIIIKISTT